MNERLVCWLILHPLVFGFFADSEIIRNSLECTRNAGRAFGLFIRMVLGL